MKNLFDIVKRVAVVAVLATGILYMTPLSSSATPENRWFVKLQVSYLADSNTVTIGAATDATEAYEASYAATATKSRYLSAYIDRSDWKMDTDFFRADVKGVDLPKSWTFYVQSRFTKDLTVSWDLSKVPSSITLTLVDTVAGTSTVMTEGGTYIYKNSSTSPRAFDVVATGTFDIIPPDTLMVNPPSGYVGTGPFTVDFSGTDNATPVSALAYSYSLDEGATWSAYSTVASATFSGLIEGDYVLNVKARDETGNEDATPAEAIFTVGDAPTTVSTPAKEPKGRIVTPPNQSKGRFRTPPKGSQGRFSTQ